MSHYKPQPPSHKTEEKMKTRLIIPVLMLATTLVYAGYASFSVLTINSTAEVLENISASETAEFTGSLYPGEATTWVFTVDNAKTSGAQSIEIAFTPSPSTPGVTYSVTVTGDGPDLDPCISAASGPATCAPISIPADGTITVTVALSIASDATPGSATISATVLRV